MRRTAHNYLANDSLFVCINSRIINVVYYFAYKCLFSKRVEEHMRGLFVVSVVNCWVKVFHLRPSLLGAGFAVVQ